MAKMDFSKIDAGRVYDQIAEATAEPVQELEATPVKESTAPADNSAEAVAENAELIATVAAAAAAAVAATTKKKTEFKAPDNAPLSFSAEMEANDGRYITQGRKGLKMRRINMAFTPENYDYLKTMARVSGRSITEFTNYVIKQHMQVNDELYKKAREFRDSL